MSLVLKTIRFGAVMAFLTNSALLKGAENDASNLLGEWPTYRGNTAGTVSYTHLTLPTILLV